MHSRRSLPAALAAVLGIAIAAAGAFLAVGVSPADAYTGTSPLQNPANWTTPAAGGECSTWGLLSGICADGSYNWSASAKQWLGTSEEAVGAEPELTAVGGGILPLTASGLLLGVSIGTALNNYFHISCSIAASCGDSATRTSTASFTVQAAKWQWYGPGSSVISSSPILDSDAGCVADGCFVLWTRVNSGAWELTFGFGNYPASQQAFCDALAGFAGHCVKYTQSGPGYDAAYVAPPGDLQGAVQYGPLEPKPASDPGYTAVSAANPTPSNPGFSDPSVSGALGGISNLSPGDQTDVGHAVDPAYGGPAPTEPTPTVTMPTTVTDTTPAPAAPTEVPSCDALTASACSDAMDAAGLNGSVIQAPIQGADATKPDGAILSIDPPPGSYVAGGTVVTITTNPDVIELLRPLPNETYGDYLARLQTAGWVGTVSFIDDSAYDPDYAPDGGIVRVQYPDTAVPGGTRVLDPKTWPTTPVPIAPGTGIVVTRNPPATQTVPIPTTLTTTTVTTGTDGQPTTTVGTTTTIVVPQKPTDGGGTGSVDFTPLEQLPTICKFPFGVFCWAKDVVGALKSDPIAPEIDWVMPEEHVNMGALNWDFSGGEHYDVSLAWLNQYMSWVRTMESFVLWIGAIWFVGSRWIGFKGGGDPTDAIDSAPGGVVA